MDVVRACGTIENFCANASVLLRGALSAMQERQVEARKRDMAAYGQIPDNSTYEHGDEIEVAYETASVSEALELLGPFSLVYLTSYIEKFLLQVVEDCGWSVPTGRGSNYNKVKKTIEKRGGFNFDGGPIQPSKIEELFLARNDWVHNRGLARAEYTGKISSPRFVKDGCIAVTTGQVAEITKEIRQFADFIVSRCLQFSKPFPNLRG